VIIPLLPLALQVTVWPRAFVSDSSYVAQPAKYPLEHLSHGQPDLATRPRSDRPLNSGHAKSESAVTRIRNPRSRQFGISGRDRPEYAIRVTGSWTVNRNASPITMKRFLLARATALIVAGPLSAWLKGGPLIDPSGSRCGARIRVLRYASNDQSSWSLRAARSKPERPYGKSQNERRG
jgi:hypothetical protein